MRVTFFAAKPHAVAAFEAVIDASHEVAALVTDPNREKGHGPEVLAGAWRLPVLEPADLKSPDVQKQLADLDSDVNVVVGYEPTLPAPLLKLPPRGTVKLHPSLLPRHRGAAPVPWAILNGDSETGVTTFLMKSGQDTGPILLTRSTPIGEEETAGELGLRLARLGAQVLLETLSGLAAGKLKSKPQGKSDASEAPAIEAGAGRIDWSRDAETLARRLRAFHPWPGNRTVLGDLPVQVLRATPGEASSGEPGTIVAAGFNGVEVACGSGTSLRLTLVQSKDQRAMSPSAFISRVRLSTGDRFG